MIAANTWRRGFNIYNGGSVACYIGLDSSVTTSTGTTVLPTASFTSDGLNNYKGNVYMAPRGETMEQCMKRHLDRGARSLRAIGNSCRRTTSKK